MKISSNLFDDIHELIIKLAAPLKTKYIKKKALAVFQNYYDLTYCRTIWLERGHRGSGNLVITKESEIDPIIHYSLSSEKVTE